MTLRTLLSRSRSLQDVPGGSCLVEQWLEAVSSAGEPGVDEVAARWRATGKLSKDEVARYAMWHRLRLTAAFHAAQAGASPGDLDHARAEAATRAAEFETHLRWMRQQATK
jgi:hypothetical protein